MFSNECSILHVGFLIAKLSSSVCWTEHVCFPAVDNASWIEMVLDRSSLELKIGYVGVRPSSDDGR